jgi:hypothetical protein
LPAAIVLGHPAILHPLDSSMSVSVGVGVRERS